MNDKKSVLPILLIVLLLGLALPNIISLIRGPAQVPDVFSDGYSLDQARVLSAESGKPIFALATADWCAPCQTLKRGPLQDPDVIAMIREHSIPVYLEDGENRDEIKQLGPRGYPTSFIVENDEVVAKYGGGGKYKEFLLQELVPIP
jgi:thiol:disulfide interchange protein